VAEAANKAAADGKDEGEGDGSVKEGSDAGDGD